MGGGQEFHINIESKILFRLWKIPAREQPRTYVHGRRKLLETTTNSQPEVEYVFWQNLSLGDLDPLPPPTTISLHLLIIWCNYLFIIPNLTWNNIMRVCTKM